MTAIEGYMKILIIDDDAVSLRALEEILKENDFEVIKAASVNEAIEQVKSNPDINLAICDIMMPDSDGFDFLHYLKKNPGYKNLPVIMCSALSEDDYVFKSLKAGAKDYIVKPFRDFHLIKKIKNILSIKDGSVLIIDDQDYILETLTAILERENYWVLQARNAQTALDLLSRNKINIVISDIVMPGINGIELLKTVKKKYPEIRFVLMTGYLGTYTAEKIAGNGADGFISKPFKNTDIIDQLRKFS
jgi:DNA-binding NtrC family response regulator